MSPEIKFGESPLPKEIHEAFMEFHQSLLKNFDVGIAALVVTAPVGIMLIINPLLDAPHDATVNMIGKMSEAIKAAPRIEVADA